MTQSLFNKEVGEGGGGGRCVKEGGGCGSVRKSAPAAGGSNKFHAKNLRMMTHPVLGLALNPEKEWMTALASKLGTSSRHFPKMLCKKEW